MSEHGSAESAQQDSARALVAPLDSEPAAQVQPETPQYATVEDPANFLFTDGLIQTNHSGGYRGSVAARAAGITYRQLDYWARTELVQPTVKCAKGSGSQRLYGFRDILVLKLVKRLLETGISLQQIRIAIEQLHQAGIRDLATITLMSDGASVYLCTSTDEVIDLVSRGQGVFGIAVGKVLREVETTLIDLSEHAEELVDELAKRRQVKRIS